MALDGPTCSYRQSTQGELFRLAFLEIEFLVAIDFSSEVSKMSGVEVPTLVPGCGPDVCRMNDRIESLHLQDEVLTWESPQGERLKNIVFVQGVQNGIK